MSLEQRLARLERDVTELRATEALRRLLSQYAVAVDDRQPDLLRRVFTEDAHVAVPAWSVDVRGGDAVLAFYEDYWTRFANPRRYFANADYRVTGTAATCFMYWHVTQERHDRAVLGWGTYDWRFRRDGIEWRIAAVTIDIRAMTTLEAGWAGARRFTDA
ncbi:MAG: nuclear transport factor 2 family protein [Gammaproteobacteria bacterium]